jgi:hypothetical protein
MQRTAAIIDRDMNPVPTFDELMQPAFAALRSRRGSVAKQTLLADVIHRLELPESVVNQPHGNRPGQTELGYRLSWALTPVAFVGGALGGAGGPSRRGWFLNHLSSSKLPCPNLIRPRTAESNDNGLVTT